MIFRLAIFISVLSTTCTWPALSSEVNVAIESEPRSFDPRYATDANSQYLMDLVHCSLIKFDQNGQISSNLAESWTWVDNRTIKFIVRDGIKFSNGTPVKTDDVKATYEFFAQKDTKQPSPLAGAFAAIESITTDKQSVTFKLKDSDTSFIQNFSIGILPKELASGGMLDGRSVHIGCGPFNLKQASVSSIELTANQHYNVSAPAKLKGVSIKIVKDEQTRYAKLLKGEIDIVQNGISRDKIAQIAKSSPNLTVLKRPSLSATYMGFNMRDPVLKNKNVREAINSAIDREQIINYILKGMAIPARTMLPPSDPYFNKSLPMNTLDLAKANKLLDEAGYKHPKGDTKIPRFNITLNTTTDTTRISIAQAIASQLAKVGIRVQVQSLEWGKFSQDVSKGQVQSWTLSWVGFKDPDIYRHAFATNSAPPNGGNRGWFSNPVLDKILDEAKRTTDVKKRKILYDKVQTIVAEQTPYAFLWHDESFGVVNKRVQGFNLYADGRWSSLAQCTVK